MDKTAVANIDANMGRYVAFAEKNQVAGAQGLARDFVGRHHRHLCSGSRQVQRSRLGVDEGDQTAAIKATLRGIAAVNIRRADQAKCPQGDLVGALRCCTDGWCW